MADEFPGPIPGVSESELAGAAQSFTKIPTSTLNDHERFSISVRALVEARARTGWKNEGASDVAAFVLTPYPRDVGEKLGAKGVSDLEATDDPILGRIFFLNRDASSGRGMDLPTAPNELLEWLIARKLENNTVVLAYRNTKLLVTRAKGAAGDTRKDVIRDTVPVATLAEIGAALTHAHLVSFVTPTVCPPGVWEPKRSGEYVPGPQPEKAIQRELATTLASWFHGVVKAETEDAVGIGRIDIRLLTRAAADGTLSYWVVLELKVVRSKHSAPKGKKAKEVKLIENAENIAEGIRQAFAFGKNRNAEPLLEIYDLRKDKSDNVLAHSLVTGELAKCSPKPQCRVWPLSGSSADARKEGWS
jgi:hypothetical protein